MQNVGFSQILVTYMALPSRGGRRGLRLYARPVAPPGCTQLPLHVFAVEEVAEEELVLVDTAVGDDQRQWPFHGVF